MNSKHHILSLLIVVLIPLFGCGLKFGEKVKPTDIVEFESGSCVTDSNQITKAFFKGQAQDDQVSEAVDCYAKVIETFRDNVRGSMSDAFTPEEIQVFLKNNFLKDSEFDLTLPLVEELMKVKVVLVGGTRFLLTHDELTKLSQTAREIKADVVAFNPAMEILFGRDHFESHTVIVENARVQAEISTAGQLFTENLVKLARIFKFSSINYRVDEFYDLILEVLNANRSSPETIDKMMRLRTLVRRAAEVFIEDRQILNSTSWPRLLKTVGTGYVAYRRYDLLIIDDTKNLGLDELTLEKIVFDVHSTLDFLISEKSLQRISNAEIRELLSESKIVFSKEFLDSPDLAKWVQKILDLKLFNQLMDLLWTNVLNVPEQRLQGKPTNELDHIALKTIVDELSYLFRSQSHVYRMFEQFKLQGKTGTKVDIKAYLQSIINADDANSRFYELDLRYAKEHLQMFQSVANFNFTEENYLKILDDSNSSADAIFTVKDVEKSNYARASARLLIRAFSTNLEFALNVSGISKADALAGWEMARPIANELDFVQPDNLKFMASRFREADLFISSSNGDDIGQFAEAHDLILHIYSGKNRSDALRIDLVNQILPGSDPESFKPKDTIAEVPLVQFFAKAQNGFQALPKYQQLVSGAPNEMPQMALSLLKAAGHSTNPENLVKFEDLDLYSHVVQYIEMIFLKFDTNRDGTLDKFEAVAAYPYFEKTVGDVLEKLDVGNIFPQPERRKGIFLYLLKMGRFYEGKDEFKDFTKFINDNRDINTTDKWDISSNRIILGRLFNFLADKLNKPDDKDAPPKK